MRLTYSIVLVASLGVATPYLTHHVHEKRDQVPHGWVKRSTLDGSATLPVRVGLKQRALEHADQFLYEVSDPKSPRYGKHWTAKEVADAFAPSQDAFQAVHDWLFDFGISEDRVSVSQSLGWIDFNASVTEVEDLLKTKYHIYEHILSGQPHIACDEYSIPAHLSEHVDLILPSVHFDINVHEDMDGNPRTARKLARLDDEESLSLETRDGASDRQTALDQCADRMTPWCLRALYGFQENKSANKKNSFGIVGFTPDTYRQIDLEKFFGQFNPAAAGAKPIVRSIDGGFLQDKIPSFGWLADLSIHLEYTMALVFPQRVTLYQVGDYYRGGSLNNFLDGIDASYCNHAVGDTSPPDKKYPDHSCKETDYGCYKGPQTCGGFAATKVITIANVYSEVHLTPAYERRQCHEYMKLGLQGVSVVFSAGYSGVKSVHRRCTDPETGELIGKKSGRFVPIFPASCPYVTAVGSTQIIPGVNVSNAIASDSQPEQALFTTVTEDNHFVDHFHTGGGFSDVFPMPSYQAEAVSTWFANHPEPYNSSQFNNSGNARGYPDIAANGARHAVIIQGRRYKAYEQGHHVIGSIFTLINQARLNAGKSTIGFANPVLYAHPEVLRDVTKGSTPGCGTKGFHGIKGWDPVSGLGTPIFPKMRKLWMSLD